MLSAKGVNAWVEIKGPDGTWAKSEEYKTKVEASKVSTYIESIEGRNFRIHIQGRLQSSLFQHRHPDVSGEVLLDGVPVQRRVLYKRKNDPSIIAGQTISSDAEVPFAFAKVSSFLLMPRWQQVPSFPNIRMKIFSTSATYDRSR